MNPTLALLATVLLMVNGQETYGTDYDNLNVEAVVADRDRFRSFIDCFTGVAPCDELSDAFKRVLPEIIVEACAKCTPAQKHISKVFIEGFKKNMPEEFDKFKDKFDPERKHFQDFEAAVADF